MSPIAFVMKPLPKYALLLVILLATGSSVFAQSRTAPLERAQQIAALTAGGLHDPAPSIPASDILAVSAMSGADPYAGNR